MTLFCTVLALLGLAPSICPAPPAPVAPARAPEVASSPTAPLPPPVPTPSPEPPAIPEPWASLAKCETPPHGEWDYNPAIATWGTRLFEGGLQFHPDTWDAYRDPGMPVSAFLAPPEVQIEVAERVLAEQGWKAWPHCSRELGLR